ncbi:hypothetical protein DMENIID0001_072980 [Sergentomyia squamirostris]
MHPQESEHYNNLNGIANNNNKDIQPDADSVPGSVNGGGGESQEISKSGGNSEEIAGAAGGAEKSESDVRESPARDSQQQSQESNDSKKARLKTPSSGKPDQPPPSHHSQAQKAQLSNGKRHGSPSASTNFKRIAPAPTTSASSPHHSQNIPKSIQTQPNSERPLKCLETLAQKAGITFDEKYEVANTLIKLEKSQSPAQQPVAAQQPQPVPLTISQEQLQQLQQLQFHSFAGNAIQVKQEFPHQATTQQTMQMELKQQIVDAANQQHQQQQQAQVQQMQVIESSAQAAHQQNPPTSAATNAMGPPQTSNTISTMSPLHAMSASQVPVEWHQGRVQVLQQPLQNPAYLQQLYSPQVLMQGNILHSGLGQQQIQVIAAGKPFQSAPQMLATTAQGKPVIGSTAGGFSGAYTLPGIPSSQSQTLLFSPVSVLSSQPQQQQQQNLLPTMQTAQAGKPMTEQDMQKALSGQKVLQKVASSSAGVQNVVQSTTTATQQQSSSGGPGPGQQCVQVSQAAPTAQIISPLQQQSTQPMQFAAPWLQGVQQFWTTNGLQSQLLTPNPIIFRGAPQADGTQSMFAVQQNPQTAAPQVIQTQPQNPTITLPCNMQQNVVNKQPQRVATETIAPKQPTRAAPILPQGAGGAGGGTQQIRPASSVSTQTQQNQVMLKPSKLRAKSHTVRPNAPGGIKGDAMIQAKIVQSGQVAHSTAQSMPQQTMHQVMTSAGSKMVVMSTTPGTPINIGATQLTQMTSAPGQQIQIATDKQQSMQIQQQLQHQQKSQAQAQASAQRPPQVFQPQVVQHIQQLQQQIHQQPTTISQQAFIQTQQQQQQAVQNQLMQHQSQQQQHQQQAQQQPQQIVIQQQGGQPQVLTVTAAAQQTAIQPKPSTMVIGTSQQHQILTDRVSTVAAITSNTNPVQVLPSSGILSALSSSTNLIGPLTSPQAPLQPPPNPLVAMTTLSAAPLSNIPLSTPSTPKDNTLAHQEVTKPVEVSTPGKQIETSIAASGAGVTATTDTPTSAASTVSSSENSQPQETSGKTASSESAAKGVKGAESAVQAKSTDNTLKEVAKTNGTMATVETSEGTPEVKTEKAVLKATVKPQVLTHVIEGFVIQEASEPFAVTRQRYPDRDGMEEPAKKKQATEKGTPPMSPVSAGEMACEYCGKVELKSKMKKKRFCSLTCAKASKESGGNPTHTDSKASMETDVNGMDTTATQDDGSNPPVEELPAMGSWSVAKVREFIRNLTGSNECADEFANQEIDGQALLLVQENHLVNALGMKLGPALKIVHKIKAMHPEKTNGEKEDQTQ